MAYIGKAPNTAIVNQATSQSFSGNGSTTAFTLTRSVNVGEDLEVVVNNVQQEPGSGKSYTASGTTLTFDEAPPSGTNNVYVIYRGEATINPRLEHDANAALAATTGTFSGDFVATGHASVGVNAVDATRALTVAGSTDDSTALGLVVYNSSLASKFSVRNDGLITAAGNIQVGGALDVTTSTHANASVFKSTGNTQIMLQDTDATANDQFWGLQVSGGEFNILTCNDDRASGFVTPLTIDASGRVTMPNQPVFNAYQTSSYTITNGDILRWTATHVNIGNHFNTSANNYRFTAPIAGTYYFHIYQLTGNDASSGDIRFRKNAAAVDGNYGYGVSGYTGHKQTTATTILTLAANDYVDVMTIGTNVWNDRHGGFCGFLIG